MPSSDSPSRKKTSSNDHHVLVPEGDHRKRRRNRTTQSCLNCHTSKRMCDRKRPCGRCTQLGLTGLCVYEVDDPSQRTDTQDECSRLRNRVAELEGVIRELKNKPHPRWVQSSPMPGEEVEKSSYRAHARAHPRSSNMAVPARETTNSSSYCNASSDEIRGHAHLIINSDSATTLPMHSFNLPSPPSEKSSSPSLTTPTDDYLQPFIAVSGSHPETLPIDLSSILLPFVPYDDGTFSPLDFKINSHNSSGYHCGCMDDPRHRNLLLELSHGLRKASDILACIPNHQLGLRCELQQKVLNLGGFATTALELENTLSSEIPPAWSRDGRATLSHTSVCGSQTSSPLSATSLRAWDSACGGSSNTSWDPPRPTC